MSGFRLTWKGDEASRRVVDEVVKPAIRDFALAAETVAKAKLRKTPQDTKTHKYIPWKGEGKRTGLLQRSVHIATPGYNWSGDTGDGSSAGAEAAVRGNKITIQLGSGIEYAIYVNTLHYNPRVNRFIETSVEETRPRMPGIIARYARNFRR